MNDPVYSLSQPYTPEQLEEIYRDVVLKQEFYGTNYGSHWSPEPYREVARILQKVLAPQQHVDVGCAKGHLVAAMRELGIESHGVDFSEALVDQAPAAVRPFLAISSAEDWLERTVVSRADLLSFTDVFEHLPFSIIRGLLQELKPRFHGRIFLTLPSYGVDERVRMGSAIKEDIPLWQADMEANRPFQNIVLADGVPHHGHISHASYRWWTEFFLSGGWIRHHDLETAMMNFGQATFMKHRSNPYVLEQLEPVADWITLASTNRIGPGWHDIEDFEGHLGRWTNGNAQLFVGAVQQAPLAIELELATPSVNVIRDWYVLLSLERLVRSTPWSFEWQPLAVSPLVPLCQRGKRTNRTVSMLAVPCPTRQNVVFTDVCRLNILSPCYVPGDYNLSEDRRSLGVVVHQLRIRHDTVGNYDHK